MSFPPVYGPRSRALILGSWPSPKSWAMGFYYGHPNNRFWPLLASLTGEPVPAREDIEAKRGLILRHNLALWDVLASCTIEGASDASIRDPPCWPGRPSRRCSATEPPPTNSTPATCSRSAEYRPSGCPAPAPPMQPGRWSGCGQPGDRRWNPTCGEKETSKSFPSCKF